MLLIHTHNEVQQTTTAKTEVSKVNIKKIKNFISTKSWNMQKEGKQFKRIAYRRIMKIREIVMKLLPWG